MQSKFRLLVIVPIIIKYVYMKEIELHSSTTTSFAQFRV